MREYKQKKELLLFVKSAYEKNIYGLSDKCPGLCKFFNELYYADVINSNQLEELQSIISFYKTEIKYRDPENIHYYFPKYAQNRRVKYLNQLIKMHHQNYFIRSFWRFVYRRNFIFDDYNLPF